MVRYCVAFGCKETYKKGNGVQFHKFPMSRPELLKVWESAVRRKDWKPTVHSTLCSKHFTEDSYQKRPGATVKFLKTDAVPTIFSFNSTTKKQSPGRKLSVKTLDDTESCDKDDEEKELNHSDHNYNKISDSTPEMSSDKNVKSSSVSEKDKENIDAASVRSEADVNNESDNTYIIVVGNEDDNGVNVSYLSEGLIKKEMDNSVARLELFGKPSTDNNAMCRLCMASDDNSNTKLLPLFSKNTKLKFISVNILTVLESLTGLKASAYDDLPKFVCKVCLSRLEICWAFRQQCLKSDKVMRELNQATKQFCEMTNTAIASTTKDNLKSSQQNSTDVHKNSSEKDKVVEEAEEEEEEDDEVDDDEELDVTNEEDDDLENVKIFLAKTTPQLKPDKNIKTPDKNTKIPNSPTKRKAEEQLPPNSKLLKPRVENNTVRSLKQETNKINKCCNICNFKGNSEELDEHRKSHLATFPYSCKICNLLFKLENTLAAHVKTVHDMSLSDLDHRTIKCNICKANVQKSGISDHYLNHKTENK